MKSVSVLPAEGVWLVRSEGLENDQLFLSSETAMAAGRRLVKALWAAGEMARLEVTLQDGCVSQWPSDARAGPSAVQRRGRVSPGRRPEGQ